MAPSWQLPENRAVAVVGVGRELPPACRGLPGGCPPASEKLSVVAGTVETMSSENRSGSGEAMAAALARLPVSRGVGRGAGSGHGGWSADDLSVRPGRAVHPGLRPVLPSGLMPEVYSLNGSAQVGLGLLVEGWCAVVGLPELGVEAAREWGVELSRMVLVPDPGSWLETVATLIEGLDVVLAAAPASIAPAAAQRLVARLRSRGSSLVVLGRWPHAHARIDVRTLGWQGLGRGYGALESQRLEITVTRHHSHRTVTLIRGAEGVTAAGESSDDSGGAGR